MSSPVGSVGSRPQPPVATASQNVAPRPQPAASEEAMPADKMESKEEASGGLDVSA
jgi:hypothetical protein